MSLIVRWLHRNVLCRLGFHAERLDDPSIGWSCRYCRADGLGHPR